MDELSFQQQKNAWAKERSALLELATDLAGELRDILSASGSFGEQMDESIRRLKTADSLTEIHEIRDVLISNAEKVREHTGEMQSGLQKKREQVQTIKAQMKVMEQDVAYYREESMTDGLTGIANRRAFDQQLTWEMARANRYGRHLSLAILDLDHFKHINDTYGHATGDKVLKAVVQRINTSLRASDFLSRIGGEEFAVIFSETDIKTAKEVLNRVRTDISCLCFTTRNKKFSITVSAGVAPFISRYQSVDTFMELSDKALYKAKKMGRNRIVVVNSDDSDLWAVFGR